MDLLQMIKGFLPEGMAKMVAQQTGESEQGITSFISAALPTVLGSLMSKSSSNGGGILDMVKGAFGSGILNNILGTKDSGFNVMEILKQLFGDKLDSVMAMIAKYAGVKESSAAQLMGLSSSAAIGGLGKIATEQNLDATSFSALLDTQKYNLSKWMPAGFDFSSLAGTLGLGSLFAGASNKVSETVSNVTDKVSNVTSSYQSNPEGPKKGNGWIVPLIILAAVAGLIWWLMKGCDADKKNVDATGTEAPVTEPTTDNSSASTTATVSGKLDTVTGNWVSDLGAEKVIKLADGTEMKVGENSTEFKLYNFITNADMKVDTVNKSANWYSFDRVYFETGKSVLTAESQAQVKNIAMILKNYPNAVIKLGGYTDNTGDAAVNKKVSDSRAKMVAQELVKLGAGAKQIEEAVGYGPEFPIASNDTKEGQAQNRRVDLKVATK